MSEKKKDLSAFLKKNQKKGKKAEPVATAVVEEKKEEKVEAKKEETKVKSTTQKKDESSDEEVDDELDLQTGAMSYGNIKEKKDITSVQKEEEAEKVGFGFDSTVNSGPVSKNSEPRAKKDASDITFGGGRPKFGRKVNKGQFGAEFSEGLDDIDDDGNVKNKPKNQGVSKADGGQRDFINLSSKARVGGPREEEKFDTKPTGVKPTFKGKLNLMRNTNEQDGDFGVKVNYDFSSNVSFKTAGDGAKDRKPKAVPFEKHMATQNQAEDDDGFEIVRNAVRKPRQNKRQDSSDSEEGPSADGTKITRGDTRGTRGGRGGFFKNSKHD